MNNRKHLASHLLPGLLVVLAPFAHAADRVNAGKWESTMVTDGDTRKVSYCLSAEQAAAINADAKAGRGYAEKKSGKACTLQAYDAAGDTVKYSLLCGKITISDITHYHGDSSEGTKTTTIDGKSISTQVKSKRVGACP